MSHRPHTRAKNIPTVQKQWAIRRLPEDLTGQTVMDVGCWAGGFCAVAKDRGATRAIGVDVCRSPGLLPGVEFYQLDFMSDAALQLPQVDHMLLMGVLYHTYDQIGMLLRARQLTRKQIWIETAVSQPTGDFPSIKCYDDHTNWFKPNPAAVRWMLRKTGFEPDYEGEQISANRFVISGTVTDIPKSMPRAVDWMDL